MARKKTLKRGKWTKEEIKLLKKRFPGRSTQEVADELGRSLDCTKKKASRMGLYKTKKYLKSLGRVR